MKYVFILFGLFFCFQTTYAQQTPISLGIELETVIDTETETQLIIPFSQVSSTKELLFIVNGQEVSNEFVNEVLESQHIKKVKFQKNEAAKAQYGHAAINGVVIITIWANQQSEVNALIAANDI